MAEHVRVLGIVGIVRAVAGVALGIWLILAAGHLDASDYGIPRPSPETVLFDQGALYIVGRVCLALAPLQGVQGLLALLRKSLARPLGKALAVLDLVNLFFFPVSTALGLYGLVVYSHPDAADYLGCRRAVA